jgi:V/A-type H+/Na+-transporting ATPase subunit E
MTDKLEKLTKQIYDEGIAKADKRAEEIIMAAEDEKRKILRSARKESEDIISVAHKESEELKHMVNSELRMASQQMLALLRQKITGLICEKVGTTSVQGLFDDTAFLKKILEVVMKEWASSHCAQSQDFYLKLPSTLQKDIKEHFFEKGKAELNAGLKIEFDEKIKSGFVITPKDGSYRIGFTEDDFKALVQYFLRPRMKKFLFGEHEVK